MSYKKMLFVIIAVIVGIFTMMFATSYAWYSFNAGSTSFDTETSNKNVDIRFLKGEFVNDLVAVPIHNDDIDQYSDKHQFIVRVKNNPINNEILLKVSLVDVSIDESLRVKDFKVDLYHQGSKVITISGDEFDQGSTTKEISNVLLDDQVDNNFEIRIYILDNDKDQSDLMNKSFSAKIQADIVSRLKVSKKDWNNPDIEISSIMVDGSYSDSIPVDGYYTMRSSCEKNSKLSFDSYSKTIYYEKGSKSGDKCQLSFTKAVSKKLLNTVSIGSYVKYSGNNGCDGVSCKGYNANYISDNNMGYCGNSSSKFVANGWRVAYIKDDSAYLVSAGSPECVCSDKDGNVSQSCDTSLSKENLPQYFSLFNRIALKYCNSTYAYNGKCDANSSWNISDNDYQEMTFGLKERRTLEQCSGTSGNRFCGYANDLIDNGSNYWFSQNGSVSENIFYWDSSFRRIGSGKSNMINGIRPVIRLRASVLVQSGSGTYDDPYQIQ